MRTLLSVLPFIALTFFCWGNYGPLMHHGTVDMMHAGAKGLEARLLPFIFVGVAYFLIAVVVPVTVLFSKGEKGRWTIPGSFWSLSSGAVGAIGALGIILALAEGGTPVYVMPLVFGCAPVVNTFVTMLMARTWREASTVFYVGVVVVALGAAGVLVFSPTSGSAAIELSVEKFTIVLVWIAVTALSWGAYGPVLHKGQMKMQGSRLRPFMCVGLAYFAIAVVAPIAILSATQSADSVSLFSFEYLKSSLWSLGAGSAGAIGALGIIMAFNFGGKPIYVMPLVFGCAPVVNTFTTMIGQGKLGDIQPMFMGALAMVIAGAVMVLVFAPRGHGPKPDGAKKPEPQHEKPLVEKSAAEKSDVEKTTTEKHESGSHSEEADADDSRGTVDEQAAAEK